MEQLKLQAQHGWLKYDDFVRRRIGGGH